MSKLYGDEADAEFKGSPVPLLIATLLMVRLVVAPFPNTTTPRLFEPPWMFVRAGFVLGDPEKLAAALYPPTIVKTLSRTSTVPMRLVV